MKAIAKDALAWIYDYISLVCVHVCMNIQILAEIAMEKLKGPATVIPTGAQGALLQEDVQEAWMSIDNNYVLDHAFTHKKLVATYVGAQDAPTPVWSVAMLIALLTRRCPLFYAAHIAAGNAAPTAIPPAVRIWHAYIRTVDDERAIERDAVQDATNFAAISTKE